MPGPTFHYYCQNWQPNAIAMCQFLHCLFSFFFFFVCVCFASDNHLKIYQATREKIQSLLHVMSVLKQAESLISPIGKARALQPAAGNGVWLQKISKTAYTICSIYVSATFQAVPAVFQV